MTALGPAKSILFLRVGARAECTFTERLLNNRSLVEQGQGPHHEPCSQGAELQNETAAEEQRRIAEREDVQLGIESQLVAIKTMNEPLQRRRRKSSRLPRSERSKHQRAHYKREYSARVVVVHLIAAQSLNIGNLRVEHSPDSLEEIGVPHCFG